MLVSLKQHYALVMLHVCVFEATLCILSHRLELQYAYPFSPIPEEKICSVSGNPFFRGLGKSVTRYSANLFFGYWRKIWKLKSVANDT